MITILSPSLICSQSRSHLSPGWRIGLPVEPSSSNKTNFNLMTWNTKQKFKKQRPGRKYVFDRDETSPSNDKIEPTIPTGAVNVLQVDRHLLYKFPARFERNNPVLALCSKKHGASGTGKIKSRLKTRQVSSRRLLWIYKIISSSFLFRESSSIKPPTHEQWTELMINWKFMQKRW